ncbi:enoyl-CoA hydratase/isomerase family protein [bacterium]|nr:enoyl-CoA hydratase/isomerase family protein [bacterium]
MPEIKKVAVVGGGIMGAGIAGFFANIGIPAHVFDLKLELAQAAIEKLTDAKAKIPLLYSRKNAGLITPHATDELELVKDADMIIEVVPEVMKIKQDVFKNIDKYRKTEAIVTTNTSGLSVSDMVEHCSDSLKQHMIGTHFFNPVRFMALVELIPIAETKPELVDFLYDFFLTCGKRPIIGKDTPNFVGNRVGIYMIMKTFQLMQKYNFTVEQVDVITGPPLGNPKTASCRLSDMVGIDTLVHAATNSFENCLSDEENTSFDPPDFLKRMMAENLLGDKTGQGFYQKVKKPKFQKLYLDLKSFEYKPTGKYEHDLIRVAKSYVRPEERIKAMVLGGDDPVALFARELVLGSAVYALNRVGEIADDIATIDNAMKWGFGKALGPIELLDSFGLEKSAGMIADLGLKMPELLNEIINTTGSVHEYRTGRSFYYQPGTHQMIEEKTVAGALFLKQLRAENRIVRENLNTRLIDLGDGVLCLELDAKMVPNMNPVDDYVISMMEQAHEECSKGGDFKALVISNQAENFSAGAQLQLILDFSKEKRFDLLEDIVNRFQKANLANWHAPFPVVVAPHHLTLGGGMEITLGGQARVALAELYGGLVEVGVGLLPGGGGCAMLLGQFLRETAAQKPGPMPPVLKAFELIGFGKVSMSAQEAIELGYLTERDHVVLSPDLQIAKAKQVALDMLDDFRQNPPFDYYLPGRDGYLVAAYNIDGFVTAGQITDHSAKIAKMQVKVLTGGDQASMLNPVSEEYILGLEREAFLSLCGEPMSQERMAHMLKHGKPLIN